MQKIETTAEFEQLVEANNKFLLLKHSDTCPISGAAFEEYSEFTGQNPDIPSYYLIVQEARPLSNYIAETYNIKHESPQALLFINKQVDWNASHWKITAKTLGEATQGK